MRGYPERVKFALNVFGWVDPWGLRRGKAYAPANVNIIIGANGEVLSATARIRRGNLGQGTPTSRSSRNAARCMGKKEDDAGHILAKLLGGLGHLAQGVFPKNPHINRGAYRVFEGRVADAVRKHGAVDVNIHWIYGNGGTRPTDIIYEVSHVNGTLILSHMLGN